ncbi:hypothetical protein CTAYLR_002756 [Chrysophaeum taylorii]|uniref:Uncharacterized protein n=1 Tax=Chrysophaeum taylorii TaxID=2483200 RepID=A0AAD7UBZ4_9STRA|nr:hypothetical protein CTAYLR_002756 [Chrysophaeum taylorii]
MEVVERATTPTVVKDPSSGYVPEIPAPAPVCRCSGHRCLRRRIAPYVAVSTRCVGASTSGAVEDVVSAPGMTLEATKASWANERACGRGRRRRNYSEEAVLRRGATDEREAFASLAGGRYMCVRLDKRCWLEVEDARHRYAKNLRRYHHEWAVRLGEPGGCFWRWLEDSEQTSLATCAREKLETEVVRYCSVDADRRKYALRCVDRRLLSQLCSDSAPVSSSTRAEDETPQAAAAAPPPPKVLLSPSAGPRGRESPVLQATTTTNKGDPPSTRVACGGGDSASSFAALPGAARWGRLNTGPKGWIFVLHDGVLYARFKGTHAGRERFHHSSFFGGECVDAAGVIVSKDGIVTRLLPHSGHYRPREAHFARLLLFLQDRLGLDLERVDVDFQRVMRQARPEHSKKTDTPLFWSASDALAFLVRKAMVKSTNLLRDIEARREDLGGDDETASLLDVSQHVVRGGAPLRRSAQSRASLKAECQRDQQELEERMLAVGLGGPPRHDADDERDAAASPVDAPATAPPAALPPAVESSSQHQAAVAKKPSREQQYLEALSSTLTDDADEGFAELGDDARGVPVVSARSASTFGGLDDDDDEAAGESSESRSPSVRGRSPLRRRSNTMPIDEPDDEPALTPPARSSTGTWRPRARSADPIASVVAAAGRWVSSGAESVLSFSWTGPSRKRRDRPAALLRHLGFRGRSYSSPPNAYDWWMSATGDGDSDGRDEDQSSEVESSSDDGLDDCSSDRTGTDDTSGSTAIVGHDGSATSSRSSDLHPNPSETRFVSLSLTDELRSRSISKTSLSDDFAADDQAPALRRRVANETSIADVITSPLGTADDFDFQMD